MNTSPKRFKVVVPSRKNSVARDIIADDSTPGAPASAPVSPPENAVPPAAAASQDLYRALLRGLYDAILIVDPNGRIVDGNRRAYGFFQYSAEDFETIRIDRIVSGMSGEILSRVRTNLAEGRFTVLDAVCVRRDRTRFPAEIAISRLSTETRDDLVFLIRNITRRRAMEEKLRKEHDAQMQNARQQDAFAGRLNIISLTDIMQLINTAAKTGTLSVSDDQGAMIGDAAFQDGELIHARCRDRNGEAAVSLLLAGSGGLSFQFTPGVVPPPDPSIKKSLMTLLMESAQALDEAHDGVGDS